MMTNKETERLEQLLQCFFDAETTAAEEQELYGLMSRPDLPSQYAEYRPLFNFFSQDMTADADLPLQPVAEQHQPARTLRRWWQWGLCGAAAAVLLLLVVQTAPWKKADDFNPYEGSYIIRNGVKTEIPEDVARHMEQLVLETMEMNHERAQSVMNIGMEQESREMLLWEEANKKENE